MTDDRLLLIDRSHLTIRLQSRHLLIESATQPTRRLPLSVLGLVIIIGRLLISCDVWRALASANIPALLLAARGNQAPAWLGSGLQAGLSLRRRQHRSADHPQHSLRLARLTVDDKLTAYGSLLQGNALHHLGDSSGRRQLAQTINSYRQRLPEATTPAAVMGMEGAAAAAWWHWLKQQLPRQWQFTGRQRRPPPDPINSLLSLTYTLLLTELQRPIHSHGLDPALGLLHQPWPGRPSLALDLMEPLRPGADRFVLELIQQQLSPDDFTTSPQQGCRLNKAARGRYFAAWAHYRSDWPMAARSETLRQRNERAVQQLIDRLPSEPPA